MGWRRWRGATFRRGRRWDVPFPDAVVAPSVWIPTSLGSRASRALPASRRRRFDPPVAVPPPAPSPWTVVDIRTRAAWKPRTRRGRYFNPPPQFTPPPPPAYIAETVGAHRPTPTLSRRGRFGSVPFTLPLPATFIGARASAVPVRARRGRYVNPPWLDIPPPPQGPWLPGWRAPRRSRSALRVRRTVLPAPAAVPPLRGSATGVSRATSTARPADRSAGSAAAPRRTGPTMTGV